MIRQFTKDFRIIHNADRLAKRIFFGVTIGFIGFILAASLSGRPGGAPATSAALVRLISLPAFDRVYGYHDLGDISSNVLFYIPFGLFLSLVVSFPKPRFISSWLLTGFLLSALIEVCQQFVGRFPDAVDLLTNTTGFVFGFEIGVFAIKFFGLRPSAVIGINPDDQTGTKLNTLASIRFFYIAVYIVSSFVPFDCSFHPEDIFEKLHPDRFGQIRLIVDPFYHLHRWGHDSEIVTGLFLGLLPVGVLSAMMAAFRRRLHPASPVLTCVILAAVTETGQIFINSRVSDIVMIPLSIMAGLVGWLFAQAWFMLQDSSETSFFKSPKERSTFLWLMIGGYLILLVLSTLSPYRFEYSLTAVKQKLLFQSNLIPFRSHFLSHSEDSSFAIIRGIGAFLPIGLLSTLALRIYVPWLNRLSTVLITGLFAGLVAGALEILRVTGVGNYCDLTYVVLAVLGGMSGSILFRPLSKVNI